MLVQTVSMVQAHVNAFTERMDRLVANSAQDLTRIKYVDMKEYVVKPGSVYAVSYTSGRSESV